MSDKIEPGPGQFVWECGECHDIVDTSHYFEDRSSGLMQHERNAKTRAERRDRCGWQYHYDYDGAISRCRLSHGHRGSHDPKIQGHGGFSDTTWGAKPPYQHVDGANA